MKLCDAIKQTIRLSGRDIVVQKTFVSCMDDFHGFEENPALKRVLRWFCEEGYAQKLLSLKKTDSDLDVQLKTCVHDFASNYGYDESLVHYVVASLAYGLGLITKTKVPRSVAAQPAPTTTPTPQPAPNTSSKSNKPKSRPQPQSQPTPSSSSKPKPRPQPQSQPTPNSPSKPIPRPQSQSQPTPHPKSHAIIDALKEAVDDCGGLFEALKPDDPGCFYVFFILPYVIALVISFFPLAFLYELIISKSRIVLLVLGAIIAGVVLLSYFDKHRATNGKTSDMGVVDAVDSAAYVDSAALDSIAAVSAALPVEEKVTEKESVEEDKDDEYSDDLVQSVYAAVKAGHLKKAVSRLEEIPRYEEDPYHLAEMKDGEDFKRKYDDCFMRVIDAYIEKGNWEMAQRVGLIFHDKNLSAWYDSDSYKRLIDTAEKRDWELDINR